MPNVPFFRPANVGFIDLDPLLKAVAARVNHGTTSSRSHVRPVSSSPAPGRDPAPARGTGPRFLTGHPPSRGTTFQRLPGVLEDGARCEERPDGHTRAVPKAPFWVAQALSPAHCGQQNPFGPTQPEEDPRQAPPKANIVSNSIRFLGYSSIPEDTTSCGYWSQGDNQFRESRFTVRDRRRRTRDEIANFQTTSTSATFRNRSDGSMRHSPRDGFLDLFFAPVGVLGGDDRLDHRPGRSPHAEGDLQPLLVGLLGQDGRHLGVDDVVSRMRLSHLFLWPYPFVTTRRDGLHGDGSPWTLSVSRFHGRYAGRGVQGHAGSRVREPTKPSAAAVRPA